MAWQGQSGPEDSVGGISATASIDTAAIDPGLAALRSKLGDLGERLESLGRSSATSTTAIAAGMDRIGHTTNAAGYRLQVLAQGFDDLQYVPEQGLRPILNNLVQMSPALGVVAIAVDTVVRRMGGWKEVVSEFGFTGPIESAAEEMKRLGEATKLTADEQERLTRLKQADATWKENAGVKDPERMKAEAAAKAAATGGPGGGLAFEEGLARVVRGRMGRNEDEQARIDAAEHNERRLNMGGGLGAAINPIAAAESLIRGTAADMAKEVDAAVNQRAVDHAKSLLSQMQDMPGTAEGEAARRTITAMVRANPGAFPEGTLGRLLSSDPKARAADEVRGLEVESAVNAAAHDKQLADDQARLEARGSRQGRLIEQSMAERREKEAAGLLEGRAIDAAAEADLADMDAEVGPARFATRADREAAEKAAGDMDARSDAADRVNRIQRRFRDMMEGEVRQSRVMETAGLNSSVQASISNDNPQRRLLEETKEMRKQIAQIIQRLNEQTGSPIVAGR